MMMISLILTIVNENEDMKKFLQKLKLRLAKRKVYQIGY